MSQCDPRGPATSRRVILSLVLLAAGMAATVAAQAKTKATVRVLVGFSAGGGLDGIARILADGMSEALGQTFVVENRPGAAGLIAAQTLKGSAPDGGTLLLTNDHTVAILPHTMKNPGFSAARDFAPVAVISGTGAFALATYPGTQITQIKQIAEWARQNPAQANFGVPAAGGIPELAVGMVAKGLQIDAVPVAYRGGAPLVQALSAGQIPFGLTFTGEFLSSTRSKKVVLLAVSASMRSPDFPEVPTFAELGISGLEQPSMVGLYAPAGMSPAMLAHYSEAVRTVLASSKTQARFRALGSIASYGDAEALVQGMEKIANNWGRVIRESGYQPQ